MADKEALSDLIKTAPGIHDPDAAEQMREGLGERFACLPLMAQSLLNGVAGCAPYLRRLMIADPDLVFDCLASSPHDNLEKSRLLLGAAASGKTHTEQMRGLRMAKKRAALSIALADLGGVWDVMEAARALSTFADWAVEAAITAAARDVGLSGTDGVFVLAMGKQGAMELNYSSDIDLIVLFDRERMKISDRGEAQAQAVKLARGAVALLQTQTAEGYVFRTDLRLRPDPGASALAVSVAAAETYYEAYGQNWERMAFIKARPCAGDKRLGEEFLERLRPFIWRKYLDYAAIEDIHAVKRQIHAVKGGADIEFEGHDIKLGRGGIREIEFYVQTQQLIVGGKNPSLRPRATLDALAALATAGHISDAARAGLSDAYRYLRRIEHRLQMLNDEQTHRMPKTVDELERLRVFSEEQSTQSFHRQMVNTLHEVETRYADLFESQDTQPAPDGFLVFTGVDDHPETLKTLQRMGFMRGADVSEAIRQWHRGSIRATRTERARGLLTKLIPPLLDALAKAADPDEAFFAFERFLTALPSGVQVFSLLLKNLGIFDALVSIITISPHLAKQLSKQHNFIEQLLDSQWRVAPSDLSTYDVLCELLVVGGTYYESVLNAVRRTAGELRFQIAAQLAVGVISPADAARHFSAIADACIRSLAPEAERELKRQHGDIEGGLAIVGLGALGAGEMSATSDIDITFIYDAPPDAVSDGPRPLSASEYYTRLVRRIVTALSAATEDGTLYDVDMQLRPSGRAGPSAVSLAAFRRYYQDDAWTWEVMSLVRGRLICAPEPLAAKVAADINNILCQKRPATAVVADILDMRARLTAAKPGDGPWDVKNTKGGMTEIAFLCQFLALTTAHEAGPPPQQTRAALAKFAEARKLSQEIAAKLMNAQDVFESVLQLGRMATGGVFAPEMAGEALQKRMASIFGAETLLDAEKVLTKLQTDVAHIFAATLSPAGGLDVLPAQVDAKGV